MYTHLGFSFISTFCIFMGLQEQKESEMETETKMKTETHTIIVGCVVSHDSCAK